MALPTTTVFHGRQSPIRRLPGLSIVRVEHPARQEIAAHGHDLACLTLYRCGDYLEQVEAGDISIDGPSVTYHPPHQPHANLIGGMGLETLSVLFDPSLLRTRVPIDLYGASRIWRGGAVARAGGRLVAELTTEGLDAIEAMARFLNVAHIADEPGVPRWLKSVKEALKEPSLNTAQLADRLGLHPAWLARAYLHTVGESLQGTLRRSRVEEALRRIRSGSPSLADVAAETGFCDQSHMARCFKAVIGRPPSAVRGFSSQA